MGLLSQCLHHPQQLWLRRVNFQIHLWTGVVLALYVTVIGVTGSILVFGAELERLENPNTWPPFGSAVPVAGMATVIENLAARYPQTHIVSVMAPTPGEPVFTAVLQSSQRITVACHPQTGEILGEVNRKASRLEWVYDLHENLLARRTGRVVNGAAAGFLLLLALTGMLNWWPGLQNWRRALTVDFGRKWKRINFDLHSAVGFWSFFFVVVWAGSGIYFAWPAKILGLVDRLSPVVNARPPVITIDPDTEPVRLDFHAILMKSYSVDPRTQWKGVVFPASRRSPLEMLMSRSPGIGRDYEDTLYFNPYNGQYISRWQYGVNKSAGDWFVWLQIPLHFGTHWGLGIKCVWSAFGLALPSLAVTGLAMYWNRWLAKKWLRLRQDAATGRPETASGHEPIR
jgi:uncharacterized iron-regulated membrane protein